MISKKNFWYLASYPKSGNTWCRLFIQEVINLKTHFERTGNTSLKEINNFDLNTGDIVSSRRWIDDELGIDSRLLNSQEIESARRKLGLSSSTLSDSSKFYKIHDSLYGFHKKRPIIPIEKCNGIVYLIRNPLDIVVSMKHFFLWSNDFSVKFLMDKNATLKVDNNSGSQVNQYLGSWDMHVNSWNEQKYAPVLLIRYEDLIKKTAYSFTKLSKFLNLTDDKKIISKAIKRTEFSKLKQVELKKGFKEKPLGTDLFFRSGKIGEGYKSLNKNQIKKIEKEFESTLAKYDYL